MILTHLSSKSKKEADSIRLYSIHALCMVMASIDGVLRAHEVMKSYLEYKARNIFNGTRERNAKAFCKKSMSSSFLK